MYLFSPIHYERNLVEDHFPSLHKIRARYGRTMYMYIWELTFEDGFAYLTDNAVSLWLVNS